MADEEKANEKTVGQETPDNLRLDINPELKQIYMTGASGGFTHHDFRLLIFNEKPKYGNEPGVIHLVRDVNHEIIMSHLSVKELYDWLGKNIRDFEEQVGEIKPAVVKKVED